MKKNKKLKKNLKIFSQKSKKIKKGPPLWLKTSFRFDFRLRPKQPWRCMRRCFQAITQVCKLKKKLKIHTRPPIQV